MWPSVRYSKLILNISKLISQKSLHSSTVQLFYTNSPTFCIKVKNTTHENYTSDEKEKLLSFINCSSMDDLISHTDENTASNIIASRENNGLYTDVNAFLDMHKLNIDQLKKLLYAATRKNIICTPELSNEQKKSIKTILALSLSLTNLFWVRMSRELKVVDCDEIILCEETKKFSPLDIFEIVSDVVSTLPPADAYVMEEFLLPHKLLPSYLPVLLSMGALQSYIIAALNSNYAETKAHRVFIMKPNILSNHFKISVQEERVSCLHLLKLIIDKNLPHEDHLDDRNIRSMCDSISLSEKIIQFVLGKKRADQHQYGISLLLAFTFYKLVVFK